MKRIKLDEWQEIPDIAIVNEWLCSKPDCKTKVYVPPEEYGSIGIPICTQHECELTYSRTLIRKELLCH